MASTQERPKVKEKPSPLSCDQLAGSLWIRRLSALQDEGGWTVHSFSLSTGTFWTCSAHKEGGATTEGMAREADSTSRGEEIEPVTCPDKDEETGWVRRKNQFGEGIFSF